jgi:hypothetical protein
MADNLPVSEHDLAEGLTAAADTLARCGIQYAVIGGMAASYRSHARSTKDLDFLLRIPQIQLPGLLESLRDRGFEFDMSTVIREWTQQHMTVLSYRGVRVDWLKPVIPLYDHVLNRAVEENWLNHPIRVATADGLILIKLIAFRLQDQLDIVNLLATNRDSLDIHWIRDEWQSAASLEDQRMMWLMERFAEPRTKS